MATFSLDQCNSNACTCVDSNSCTCVDSNSISATQTLVHVSIVIVMHKINYASDLRRAPGTNAPKHWASFEHRLSTTALM